MVASMVGPIKDEGGPRDRRIDLLCMVAMCDWSLEERADWKRN